MSVTTCHSNQEPAAAAGNAVVLELRGVGKKFDYPDKRGSAAGPASLWALKNIDLTVHRGEVIGIIGRNGSGKSTLLNIIARVLEPDEGDMRLSGTVLGLFNLGTGFQDELTGRENIYLNGALLGASRQVVESRMERIIGFSELGDFIDMPLGTYSQGMRLRLGFAVVAHLDFDILVIDEVLAVGDALFQSKCFERLMDFKRRGKTLVITSQDMALIDRLCDTAVLLDHGNLLASGAAADTVARYRALLSSERFYVGPVPRPNTLVEHTKKWADDIGQWGNVSGTKEVIIERVSFLDRWGFRARSVQPGGFLRIRARFTARNKVKDVHFGAAIFRADGVYCYGPNTLFDGFRIPVVERGAGWFTIDLARVQLAPGTYVVSLAVWDKDERVAFDYHCGCYQFRVRGSNDPGELLSIPVSVEPLRERASQSAAIEMFDAHGNRKDIFSCGERVRVYVPLDQLRRQEPGADVLSIFSSDKFLCQEIPVPVNAGPVLVRFESLPLLPGRYEIRFGSLVYPFQMVFDRCDHGTIWLAHVWKWRLPHHA